MSPLSIAFEVDFFYSFFCKEKKNVTLRSSQDRDREMIKLEKFLYAYVSIKDAWCTFRLSHKDKNLQTYRNQV